MLLNIAYKELDNFVEQHKNVEFDKAIYNFRHLLNVLANQCSVTSDDLFLKWMNHKQSKKIAPTESPCCFEGGKQ